MHHEGTMAIKPGHLLNRKPPEPLAVVVTAYNRLIEENWDAISRRSVVYDRDAIAAVLNAATVEKKKMSENDVIEGRYLQPVPGYYMAAGWEVTAVGHSEYGPGLCFIAKGQPVRINTTKWAESSPSSPARVFIESSGIVPGEVKIFSEE